MNVFVITTKVSKTKLAALVTLLIAVLVLAAILAAAKTGTPEAADARNGETNEARVAYITRQGWQINAEPIQTQSVKIPTENTEVFTRYNELQKTQGCDLTPRARSTPQSSSWMAGSWPATSPTPPRQGKCEGWSSNR